MQQVVIIWQHFLVEAPGHEQDCKIITVLRIFKAPTALDRLSSERERWVRYLSEAMQGGTSPTSWLYASSTAVRDLHKHRLADGKPVQLKQGQEIRISTDYSIKGDEHMICMSYKKLAEDVKPGSLILCADGTISFNVLACDKERGLVRCHYENTAVLGERKNVNLPGVIVDLRTLTDKDKCLHGDLGMGIPIEKIFLAQKVMVYKCQIQGKPIVTATHVGVGVMESSSLQGQLEQKPLMLPMLFLMERTV
ncbi:Pyruvate kinase, cytosolic isozyme [Sesamum alatum]|uniref:pyruvate kinase n=1 Tax=Sesamum alatum TaxID=300844 RepID=A0AAE1Z173_9LAMI|nr:Pyruvate kinase, cytosolic isozyme [Sesamum alatum]